VEVTATDTPGNRGAIAECPASHPYAASGGGYGLQYATEEGAPSFEVTDDGPYPQTSTGSVNGLPAGWVIDSGSSYATAFVLWEK